MRMLTDVLDEVRAELQAEREAHGRTMDRARVVRDQIAQHCASFFWNDVDIGLLHAEWRDALDRLLALLPAKATK